MFWMNAAALLMQGILAAIFVLFIGPWSDRFGRKLLIITPILGFALNCIAYLLITIYFYETPSELMLLEVFQDILGK